MDELGKEKVQFIATYVIMVHITATLFMYIVYVISTASSTGDVGMPVGV